MQTSITYVLRIKIEFSNHHNDLISLFTKLPCMHIYIKKLRNAYLKSQTGLIFICIIYTMCQFDQFANHTITFNNHSPLQQFSQIKFSSHHSDHRIPFSPLFNFFECVFSEITKITYRCKHFKHHSILRALQAQQNRDKYLY